MNKSSKGAGIPAELFQILKDDAVKVLHSICHQIWYIQRWPQEWKVFSFQSQRKAMPKNVQTTTQLHSFHTLAKWCWKSSKLGFKSLWAKNFQWIQAGFRKGRGTIDQISNTLWIIEKTREFQKNIYFWVINYAKAFDCVDQNKLWKILKEMGIPEHLTWLLRNLCAGQEATVGIGHGTMDWFQIGKGEHQGCILHCVYLTSMQNTSCEMLGWMK